MKRRVLVGVVLVGIVVVLALYFLLKSEGGKVPQATELERFLKNALVEIIKGKFDPVEYNVDFSGCSQEIIKRMEAYRRLLWYIARDLRSFLSGQQIIVEVKGISELSKDLLPDELRGKVDKEYLFLWRYVIDEKTSEWKEGRVIKVRGKYFLSASYFKDEELKVYPDF